MSGVLQGRRAVVTGAGSGIGRGIALSLARAGARVALCGRRTEPLDETAALLASEAGASDVVAQSVDVTDKAAVQAAVDAITERFDGESIDVLVNNAGLGGPNACAFDGEDRWDEIIRTNMDGMFFMTRATLPRMPEGGRVVNISSVLGRFGVPGYTAYCASKHGVIGFTKALALELAERKITANAICPGWVDTEMAKSGMEALAEATGDSFEEARRKALALVPIGRIIQPAEVGDLVVYMASGAAGAMTGQAVSLCGGATMW